MSVQSLYTAATGMQAMETKLDVIANNLANVNTTAFKKGRANFEDLFYRQIKLPGAQDAQGNFTPTGIAVGLGTRVQSTQTEFRARRVLDDEQSARHRDRRPRLLHRARSDDRPKRLHSRRQLLAQLATAMLVIGSAQTGRVVQPQITFPQDATERRHQPRRHRVVQPVGQSAVPTGRASCSSRRSSIPKACSSTAKTCFTETQSSGSAQRK